MVAAMVVKAEVMEAKAEVAEVKAEVVEVKACPCSMGLEAVAAE